MPMPLTNRKTTNLEVLFALLAVLATSPAFVACGNGGTGGSSGAGGAAQGAGGSDMSAGGSSGGGGVVFPSSGGSAGACKKTGEPCTDPTECCTGNLCNNNGPSPDQLGCQVACAQNTDCPSGCCLLFQGGNNGGFCTDAKWCSCGTTMSPCSSTLPKCCDTHVCLGTDPQGTSYACMQKCKQNSDCASNCCVPIASLGVSACLDKSYCP